ncbi:MAG: ankyrin repeat domain-containing protein [Planctomycetota bacterium]
MQIDDTHSHQLRRAVIHDDSEKIKNLLQIAPQRKSWSSDVNGSALHLAAWWDKTKAAQTLLDTTPELTRSQNRRGDTPLHVAAFVGPSAENMLRLLLERDPKAAFIRNSMGHTFLDEARDVGAAMQIFNETAPRTASIYRKLRGTPTAEIDPVDSWSKRPSVSATQSQLYVGR